MRGAWATIVTILLLVGCGRPGNVEVTAANVANANVANANVANPNLAKANLAKANLADAGRSGAAAGPPGAPMGDSAVILQYHFVATDTPRVTSVTPAELEAHLDHLETEGYRVRPLPELLERLQRGESLPSKSVAITFDDGYRSVYDNAFPLLRSRNMPFTVFVNTAAIDGGSAQFATWEQLAEMQAAGATIANHSVSHPFLARLAFGLDEAAFERLMADEVAAAEARIEAELGVRHRLFAYPFGEYDARMQAWLRDHGYIGIGQHSGAVWHGSNFAALPRFPFSGSYAAMAEFTDKIRTLPLPVRDAAGLPSPTDATAAPRPTLGFDLYSGGFDPVRVACYASGQGAIPTEVETQPTDDGAVVSVRTRAGRPLPPGRSRYNCTAPTPDGRWMWFSQPWLRITPDMPAY